MGNARNFSVSDTLRNGTVVTIRAARPDDRKRIEDAFARLERASVYLRYFTYKNELGEADFARLAQMDFVRDVVLIATIPTDAAEIVIGSGRYAAHESADGTLAAEVAFIIEEDYQGIGLAGRLLHHLAMLARAAGVKQLEAEVLRENKGMLRVFARSGLPMRQHSEGGVVHLTLDLAAPGSNPGTSQAPLTP